jgi:acetolactate synthase I/III small subunit
MKRKILIALMEDRPGVLTRVASLIRRRNFNVVSLAVAPTETPAISRMTAVVECDESQEEQVGKQLRKLVNVTKIITELTPDRAIFRELALIKVGATASSRSEIIHLAEVFRAQVVDVSPYTLTIEATGTEDKMDSLIELLRPFGIRELARTGPVAMLRGASNGLHPVAESLPADIVR